MSTEIHKGEEIRLFENAAAWQRWLERHHAAATGLWLKFAKKDSGYRSLSLGEAIEVALCLGWIDSRKETLDADFWILRFTPRGARSRWSQINCAKVEALISAGRMQPAGLAEIDRAKSDGRWEAAYAPQSRATVPDDLRAALDAQPAAAAFFLTLSAQNRYAVLHRIAEAKKPETRARRIEKFVAMLAEGKTLH
ncbi:YdeI/OmpD-associated family protein [Niveibacterium sp. SC-1]|uniref:YdeI/OmpD-associated family protein n=1 Tax=Niveibacterium sp. SC-1 TaxID=3135646 RepID=UPI00311EF6A7